MLVEYLPAEIRECVREARLTCARIGLVPTMGALHDGHVSLIDAARQQCDYVVATIFVNPTQFSPGEDFDQYPRTLADDLDRCESAGADVVFIPDTEQMYLPDAQTVVRVTGLTQHLEGATRPAHFEGVTTVVAKLFHIADPNFAYFGQKDYQQQLIIRQMVKDLNWDISIVTCPIIREADGLAMSSRNRYLSPEQHQNALVLNRALQSAKQLAAAGESPESVERSMQRMIAQQDGVDLDYAVVRNSETLEVADGKCQEAVAMLAARVGETRLIDNAILSFA